MKSIPSQTTLPVDQSNFSNIHRAFEHAVESFAKKHAIATRDQEVTYAELNALANGLAHHLHSLTNPQTFVVTMLGDSIDILVAILAISKAGCIRVPLDVRQPSTTMESILRQFDAAVIIADRERQEIAQRLSGSVPLILLDIPSQERVSDNLTVEVSLNDYFSLSFTSGSTGTPKGNLRLQAHQLESLTQQLIDMEITAEDRLLCFDSLNYNSAFSNVRNTIVAGARVDRLELADETPASIVDWIVEKQVTILSTIPSAFRALFTNAPTKSMPSIRLVRLSTEPVFAADFQLFKDRFAAPESWFMNLYGSSEMGYIGRYFANKNTAIAGALVPVGKPIPNTEIQIVDGDLKPVAQGESGEILIRKRLAPDGYWQSPEQSEKKFLTDSDDPSVRLFRTGDIGYMLPDGNLVHLGRSDAMVKIRGFRVEIALIENALLKHPRVETAVVRTVIRDSVTHLLAYLVTQDQQQIPVPELRIFLGEHIPDFMFPAQYIFLDSLPKLSTGKVNFSALPSPEAQIRDAQPPKSATEERLLTLFQKILPVKTINREDYFFDLGGDSLKVIRLIADINLTFRTNLTPSTIYRYGTLEQLAAYIDSGRHTTSSLVAINPYGSQPLLIGVPGHNGDALRYQQLVSELGHDYPLYAFQHPSYEQNAPIFDSVEALAAHYVALSTDVVRGRSYYLVGYSLGGLIVFEMAQQLTRAGIPPLGVIMFDANFPSEGVIRQSRQAFLDARHCEALQQDSTLLRLRKLLYTAKRTLIKQMDRTSALNERMVKRVKAETLRTATGYQPKPFNGKVFYLTCRGNRSRNGEPEPRHDLEWQKLTIGGFELFDTDGDHMNMLDVPHVRAAARHVKHIVANSQAVQP